MWTFFCRFQTLLFQVLGNFFPGDVCLFAPFMETEDFGAYLYTDACNVASIWIYGCSHQISSTLVYPRVGFNHEVHQGHKEMEFQIADWAL